MATIISGVVPVSRGEVKKSKEIPLRLAASQDGYAGLAVIQYFWMNTRIVCRI